jgi:hypothetical protein
MSWECNAAALSGDEEAPERRPFHVESQPAALMQPAEQPNEKDDRNRNSEQPEQYASTHFLFSSFWCRDKRASRPQVPNFGTGDSLVRYATNVI